MLFGPISKISITGFIIVSVAFVSYFFWTQYEFEKRATEMAKYKSALQETVQAIDDLQTDLNRSTIGLETVDEQSAIVRERSLALSKYLSIVDLEKMAALDPAAMELSVNAATQLVLEELRRLTDKDWVFIEDTQVFKEVGNDE